MGDRRTVRQPNNRLRQQRLLRGWSQQEVANRVGTATRKRTERKEAFLQSHIHPLFLWRGT